MSTKTDQIRAAWFRGDQIGALRIAARFFDRSTATKTFQRGMDANNHPGFYRQLGKEPQELVTAAHGDLICVDPQSFRLPVPLI